MLKIQSLLFIVTFFWGEKLYSQSDEWTQKIDALIGATYQDYGFHGSISVAKNNEIFYAHSFGLADRKWNIPVDSTTRFDIASINKSFQAALILLAQEENQLKITDPVKKYLPGHNFDSRITIHHLLTHTSGIADYDGIDESLRANNFEKFKKMKFNNEEYVSFISKLPVHSEVGKEFHYSNFAYHLLPIILEKVYHKSFQSLLKEKICHPFKLNRTFCETDNSVVHKNVAEGYKFDKTDSTYKRNEYIDLSLGRRIFSTSNDLVKWMYIIQSNQLISKASYDLMTTNHVKDVSDKVGYGYGLAIQHDKKYAFGNLKINENYVIHGGSTEGYKSIVVNINDGETVIAILSNIGDRINELNLCQMIAQIIYL